MPKARVAGETASWPLIVPTPAREIVNVVETVVEAPLTGTSRPRRLLVVTGLILVVPVREMIPVSVPLAAGVKLTPMDAVFFGASTRGMLGPVMANPDPTIEALVIVMVPRLGLDTVTECVWVFPTGTLPKLMLLAFSETPPDAFVAPF